jgi:HAD superfamily hydrolase (TIGR01509 family)
MVRGIIFDCDGVLFDGLQANMAYYSAILRHFDLPPIADNDQEKIRLCHTATTAELLETILGPQRLQEALAVAGQLDYRHFIPLMVPMPHIEQVVSYLSARMPLAIATNRGNSMHDLARHFRLERFFQEILTCRDVARGKPHPDMLLLAARRLRLAPQDLLYVGDTPVDQEAARQAGVRFVGYRSDFADALTISDHTDLPRLVERL